MDVKKCVIYETDCEFAVYGDTYTRFFADGDFHTVPNNVEGAAREKDRVSRRNMKWRFTAAPTPGFL